MTNIIDEMSVTIDELRQKLAEATDAHGLSEIDTIRRNLLEMQLEEENAKLRAEVARLQATLDGDPYQNATPIQRRAWGESAIRYADKLEIERDEARQWARRMKAERDEARSDAAFTWDCWIDDVRRLIGERDSARAWARHFRWWSWQIAQVADIWSKKWYADFDKRRRGK